MDVGGGERLPAVAPGGGKSGGADNIAELEACEDLAEDVAGRSERRSPPLPWPSQLGTCCGSETSGRETMRDRGKRGREVESKYLLFLVYFYIK
jgi:hypothetical protein